jgi:sulfur-oxidizing protein SoxY
MQTRREAIATSVAVAAALFAAGCLAGARAGRLEQGRLRCEGDRRRLKALGAGKPVESKDVTLTAPDIAENGAVVPIGAAVCAARRQALVFLVEKNPTTLAGSFELTDAVESSVATRVKMAQTSNVFAVAMLGDGRTLFAKKEVKVTLGGCGG